MAGRSPREDNPSYRCIKLSVKNDSVDDWLSTYEAALAAPGSEQGLAKIEDAERAIKRALRNEELPPFSPRQ
jgi:hypothetical protein